MITTMQCNAIFTLNSIRSTKAIEGIIKVKIMLTTSKQALQK